MTNRILFDPEARKECLDEIRNYVLEHNCTFIDACLEWCEKHDVEPELIAQVIDRPMKEKLEAEGQELHLLPRKSPGLDV